MNDYQFKLVKIQGEFVWHSHADTDETFIVIDGELRIDLRDGAVTLAAGEMAVPRGVEHRPHAERGLRPADRAARVRNTGDGGGDGERTAPNDVWI